MSLVATLEARRDAGYEVISRGLLPIWMKSAVNERDLLKRRRQSAKGAAHHKLIRESPCEYACVIFDRCKKMGLPVNDVIKALQDLREKEDKKEEN